GGSSARPRAADGRTPPPFASTQGLKIPKDPRTQISEASLGRWVFWVLGCLNFRTRSTHLLIHYHKLDLPGHSLNIDQWLRSSPFTARCVTRSSAKLLKGGWASSTKPSSTVRATS